MCPQHSGDSAGSCGHGSRHNHGGDCPTSPWEIVDAVRDLANGRIPAHHGRFGPRMGRGDVRAAILTLLGEEPMHGYQIIREIETRSHGVWKPSAGSVYPTLQMLADEGLVEVEESEGRKTYRLTDAGREEAAGADEESAPWQTAAAQNAGRTIELPKAATKLAQAVGQIARGGDPEQIAKAVTILDDARRGIYTILSQE
ncbi:PadR family transcriptional regulator [Acidipropionibacterium jensenii]|uniref:PadR family transcriptional regulator n=1 Tax=Acidipropionibacterium jensenii TaxID=1749 RepID=A0A3Q9UER2_9ACTN|nr:PadR family transcriptional regulator [Acidipropionibacterium jensenii]AZZ40223.1 PadR family transcriptional regulator [Acidipropionibacterium jensenii]